MCRGLSSTIARPPSAIPALHIQEEEEEEGGAEGEGAATSAEATGERGSAKSGVNWQGWLTMAPPEDKRRKGRKLRKG